MQSFRQKCRLMGSAFELCVVSEDEVRARQILETGIKEIQRIESILTEFKDTSITSIINQNAGTRKTELPDEVFNLIYRCQKISKLTNGAFDITVRPLKQLYNFKKEVFEKPSRAEINKALQNTGYEKLMLDPKDQSVRLDRDKMEISFAAIGKGYAADAVKKIWQANGIRSGYINASGDLTAFGCNANGEEWKVGIAHPDNKEEVLMYLPIKNMSVATSGDYEQYFIHNGRRYSHNINPKTGLPLCGLKSVTIVSPGAELSDALATAVYVMSKEKGLAFVNRLPNTHAIIIDEENEVSFSKKLVYETVG